MRLVALTVAGLAFAAAASAQRADTISIVGSSTVFPFSTKVAETFGEVTDFNTPVIESTLRPGRHGAHPCFYRRLHGPG